MQTVYKRHSILKYIMPNKYNHKIWNRILRCRRSMNMKSDLKGSPLGNLKRTALLIQDRKQANKQTIK